MTADCYAVLALGPGSACVVVDPDGGDDLRDARACLLTVTVARVTGEGPAWRLHGEIEGSITALVSQAGAGESDDIWMLGRDGEVWRSSGEWIVEERTVPVGNGFAFDLGQAGGGWFACGSQGGLFVRQAEGDWEPVTIAGRDVDPASPPDYRAIHACSPTDVYCVGSAGAIAHYDGTDWAVIQSPVGNSFEAVLSTDSGEVFIAGGDVLLRGDSRTGFTVHTRLPFTNRLYALAQAGGTLYAAGVGSVSGTWRLSGDRLVEFDGGLPRSSVQALAGGASELWGVGGVGLVHRLTDAGWQSLDVPLDGLREAP